MPSSVRVEPNRAAPEKERAPRLCRIFFVYQRNPNNRFVQSGRPYALLQELKKTGCEVRVTQVGTRRYETITRIFAAYFRATGRGYVRDRFPPYLRALSRAVEQATASAGAADFVFAPSTLPFYHARCRLPTVICVDAPFHAMIDYYPDFLRLPKSHVRDSLAAESRVLARSRLSIVPSRWAAAALERCVPGAVVKVLPFGANWGAANTREYAEACIDARIGGPCRVLFVGRERYRKGFDLVEQTARIAEASGIDVEFDVVGIRGHDWRGRHVQVSYHGILDPNGREANGRMTRLWERSCFLMIPTRAEAYGMSFCEANAFGMPFLTLGTGGCREILRGGVNGFEAAESTITPTAIRCIQRFYADPSWYRSIGRSSYEEFSRRLNWGVFGNEMRASLSEVGLLP